MGKFNLGNADVVVSNLVDNKELDINCDYANNLTSDMVYQLDNISSSLNKINNYLNKAITNKYVSGTYADVFNGWSNKCKTQAANAKKRKNSLKLKYNEDKKDLTIKKLYDRLEVLEKKVNNIENLRGEE